VRRPGFLPDAGDVVWLEFDPQVGHEQAGHRPAVVLSAANYNGKTGHMVCCPLTTRIKWIRPRSFSPANREAPRCPTNSKIWTVAQGALLAKARSRTWNCGKSGRNCGH
jgi:hypothetical protein